MKTETKYQKTISAIGYLIAAQVLSPAQICELIAELIKKAQADTLNQ